MSDAPDVLLLGVEPDESGFERINSEMDALQARIDSLYQSAADAAMQGNEAALTYANSLRDIQQAAGVGEQSIASLKAQVDDLTASYQNMTSSVSAGDTGGGDDGGGGVSLYGLSRGLSSAGALARRAGAGGAGGDLQVLSEIVRVQNAFDRLAPSISAFNDSIEASPGLLSPVIDGLSGLGVPLAGLVAIGAPVAAALGGVAIELNNVFNTIKEGQKAVDAAVQGQVKYYELIQTGTTASIQKEIDKEQVVQSANDRALADARNSLNIAIQNAAQSENYGPDQIKQFQQQAAKGDTGGIDIALPIASLPGIHDLIDNIKKLQDASDKAKNNIDLYTTALGNSGVKANDLKESAAKADAEYLKSLDAQTAAVKQQDADLKLSAQANRDKQAALTDEYAQTAQNIQQLQEHGIQTAADQEKLDGYMQKLHSLNIEIGNLAENLTAAENKEIAKATATEQTAETTVSLRAETEKQRILQDGIQKELQIRQAEADKIAEIQQNLADNIAREQLNYSRQQQDDVVKYNDNLQRLQIDAQRTALEDQISYEERIADIKRQANLSEQQALLDRNFLQIAKDEMNKNASIQKETDSYADREEKLQRHLQNQEQDLYRSLQQQEEQQQVAESRKIQDLQTAEYRQIEVAQDAEAKALASEQMHVVNLYNLREQAHVIEIAQLQRHLQDQINAILGVTVPQQSAASGGSSVPVQSHDDAYWREIVR